LVQKIGSIGWFCLQSSSHSISGKFGYLVAWQSLLLDQSAAEALEAAFTIVQVFAGPSRGTAAISALVCPTLSAGLSTLGCARDGVGTRASRRH
jgi:hypothetical protein